MTALRGQLLENESLQHYNTWRVGGPAKRLYKPADVTDLQLFMRELPRDEPVFWLGLGSNLLIRDGGYAGTIILTQGRLKTITPLEEQIVRAEAGVACATMARFCARKDLTGLEFLAGIPGTIGGALKMNAGCHNSETWQFVKQVLTMDRSGELHQRSPKEFEVAYRFVQGKADEWFIAGDFELNKGDKTESLEIIRKLLERREATQPINAMNCGSVFRNPPNDFAARMIEACGLKGLQHGDAQVSTKHANFIINCGQATAKDIEYLIQHVQTTVAAKFDVTLHQEVHIIGNQA